MKNLKASPLSLKEIVKALGEMLLHHEFGKGVSTIFASLVIVSFLASIQTGKNLVVYTEGEIATQNVIASKNLLIEDKEATKQRLERALLVQPSVYDLELRNITNFRDEVIKFLRNISSMQLLDQGLEELTDQFNHNYKSNLLVEDLQNLTDQTTQNFISSSVLAWFDARLKQGVITDLRMINLGQAGIIIRDTQTGNENFRVDTSLVTDIRNLMLDFTHFLRSENINSQVKDSLVSVLFPLVIPTLNINQELTSIRNSSIRSAIEPVYYVIKKGELVVRQGEMVSREQQLIMQNMLKNSPKIIDPFQFIGLLILSIILSIGFFATPSGNKGTRLSTKDEIYIAMLILFFGIMAFGIQFFIFSLINLPSSVAMTYAFPVSAAAGLATLIFSAKRYCVIGLIVAFLSTVLLKGSLPSFIFFFSTAMLNTWLILRSYNRQDVIRSALPLGIFTIFAGFAAALMDGVPLADFGVLLIALLINVLLSITLIFVLSPILEMSFGFTTRFRLMELMNLEQPLLQELMMTIPGTYHHSLIVSNMVEAAAKVVGANSLLCKVGALYHDIGKLSHPEYFVENQFDRTNKHDKLSPAMSALILNAHVKKGIEMAAENKLGVEIENIICEHHGTRMIRFFYQKAVDNKESPRVEDYSYPGPRPQSCEAALVMIADAVEASSRTLTDPTPARIISHVDNIIKGIFEEGQLDEATLTFKDLNKIAESFARILIGLFHQRIAYPDAKKGPENKEENKASDNKHETKTIDNKPALKISDSELSSAKPV